MNRQSPSRNNQIIPNRQCTNAQIFGDGLLRIGVCSAIGIWLLSIAAVYSFAQDSNKITVLSKQIIAAKSSEEAHLALEELKGIYFQENKYNDFIVFLRSLITKKASLEPAVNYYIGAARYYQLKYLEEKQGWDEYFSNGNDYRDELVSSLTKALAMFAPGESLLVYSRLILWKFHWDMQDSESEGSLTALMDTLKAHASSSADTEAIKVAAAELLAYGEKGKAGLVYKIYVDKLLAADTSEEKLKEIAVDFYDKGSLELAESVYDAHIDRISAAASKEALAAALTEIGRKFAYTDSGRPNDPAYAEKIFQRLEALGVEGAFDDELLYVRAYNLEKNKEYPQAKDAYINLLTRFPLTRYADEARYKLGIFLTYILRDYSGGAAYFEKLAQQESVSPQVISSLYQLGILSQWKEDFALAKEHYDALIAKAQGSFSDTVMHAKERLAEMDAAKPLEYNLKTFLDVALKEEYKNLDMSKVDLSASPYKAKTGSAVTVNASPFMAESGCFAVELQYLWSGHLGSAAPSMDEPSFEASFGHPGTKEINVVVVSASGIIDYAIDAADIAN